MRSKFIGIRYNSVYACLSSLLIINIFLLSSLIPFHMKVKVAQSCLTLCNLMGYTVHGILQARITGVGILSLLQGNLSNLGIKPRSPALQEDSLPAEP